MRVTLDISQYWPIDEQGNPKSTNKVYEELRGTPNEIGRNTLRLAREGNLDRGHFVHLIKLADLCTRWTGRAIEVKDLFRIEED